MKKQNISVSLTPETLDIVNFCANISEMDRSSFLDSCLNEGLINSLKEMKQYLQTKTDDYSQAELNKIDNFLRNYSNEKTH